MAIAHHANYVVWFEIGRTDLIRANGITYKSIEERGLLLVVVEIGCRYRIPYHYDDEVVIRTAIGEAASRSVTFHYELLDGEGTRLHASGLSKHIWLDRSSRKPVKAPDDLTLLFESLTDARTPPSYTTPARP
jgi:acyl-CoA thioester hydrolase